MVNRKAYRYRPAVKIKHLQDAFLPTAVTIMHSSKYKVCVAA